jgi:putative ABC transport system permease protein
LFLGWWGVVALKRLAPPNIPRLDQVGFDAVTFLFAVGVATVTALLFGLGPAISIVRTPVSSLMGTRGTAGGRQRGRSALLVTEVALSFMLLSGAGLLVRSMVRLQAIHPGWTSDGMTVFTVALPAIRYPQPADVVRTFEQLDERFSAIPGVESVARINGLPLGTNVTVLSFARVDRPAPLPGQEPSALFRTIDTEYLRTAGIALLAGRDFDARDRQGAPPVAIVSRELADELWRGEDPIGKQIAFTKTRRTIVGVAEGVRSTNIQAPPQPEMYVPHAQTANRAVTFVIKSSLPASQVIASSRNIVRAVDSRLPLIQPRAVAQIEAKALGGPRV